MAATDHPTNPPVSTPRAQRWGRIALAACALPGVMPVQAEEAPEQALVAVKMAGYQDRQPGLQRLNVKSPSVYLLTPVGRQWSLEASGTHDDVSGASPRYYTDVTGASRMHDDRNAGDVRLTRYFERQTVSLGLSHSGEHDYVSNALSLTASHASADQNTTVNAGLGLSRDRINPVNQQVVNEKRQSTELQFGITQAVTAADLVQASVTVNLGSGYFSDPYKLFDQRPRKRTGGIGLLRWNHALSSVGGALKTSYRYYNDSFGISAHTAEVGWAKPLNDRVTLTPLLRYHTQRAASFYYDPVAQATIYPGPIGSPTYSSTDQRLSAFGAITMGLRVDWRVTQLWSLDGKLERYEQNSNWRLGGKGSPGVAPLTALQWQLGLSRRF